jgi:hypothetical protein
MELTIDRIVVETEADDRQLSTASRVVQDAIKLLGDRLKATPFAQWSDGRARVLDELRVDALSAEDLLGPRGAERLAEALYRNLLGK